MKTRKGVQLWVALFFLVFTSNAVAAQKDIFKLPSSEIQQSIQSIQKEVKAKGYQFKVGYSSAMKRPIGKLCGLKEPFGWMENAKIEDLKTSMATLPSSFDWRTRNGVTPIKNQRNCGDCWAFGTVGPLESQILLQCKVTADLSEQFLASCNTYGWGCDGGWWAHDYHKDELGAGETEPGAVKESDFPYQAAKVPSNGPYNHPYRIASWAYVSGQPNPSVQAIKQAILTFGPIAAAVYVGPKFQAYSSGIFDANEKGQINHAIVLVGWKDDLGADKGYWILRNSWGTGWGENGYMRIRYGKNQVGYAANYIRFVCNDVNPPPPPSNSLSDLRGSFSNVMVYNGGHQLFGTLKISNSGQVASGIFTVQLYLSKDGNAKTQYLGAATVSSIAEGGFIYLSFNRYSSTTLFSGKYLLAIIDSNSRVKESDEGNNNVVKLIP